MKWYLIVSPHTPPLLPHEFIRFRANGQLFTLHGLGIPFTKYDATAYLEVILGDRWS